MRVRVRVSDFILVRFAFRLRIEHISSKFRVGLVYSWWWNQVVLLGSRGEEAYDFCSAI